MRIRGFMISKVNQKLTKIYVTISTLEIKGVNDNHADMQDREKKTEMTQCEVAATNCSYLLASLKSKLWKYFAVLVNYVHNSCLEATNVAWSVQGRYIYRQLHPTNGRCPPRLWKPRKEVKEGEEECRRGPQEDHRLWYTLQFQRVDGFFYLLFVPN